MARNLTSVPNTGTPDSDYPVGKIINAIPPDPGTPVIEELYGDIVQFFHKLMRTAGISHNGLPENETQGFQFIQALAYYIRTLQATETSKGTLEIATYLETQAGIDNQRAVTPFGLEQKTATNARKGILETATNVEAQAKSSTSHIITPSNLAALGASSVFAGLIQLATNAETITGTITSRAVTPANLAAKDAGLIRKLIDIGDWNMDLTTSVSKAHGLTRTKIRSVQVLIRNDADSACYPFLNDHGSSAINIGSTYVEIIRSTGGVFDSSNFDSTSYNRGWILIDYIN